MADADACCPACGSSSIASRRQLFHQLMAGVGPGLDFSWYHQRLPGATPPRSRFVVMLTLALGMLAPILGLWFLDMHLAVLWLATLGALLLVSLVLDLTRTHRRYRQWGGEWLCAACRCVFRCPPAL